MEYFLGGIRTFYCADSEAMAATDALNTEPKSKRERKVLSPPMQQWPRLTVL